MMPVSKDTLLRVVRRRAVDRHEELHVIGIDDFAFRRGQTYGTIVCDLERRKLVTLLPDRALETSRAWLAKRPSITIVARDRGGGYGEAITRGLPDADQVADRWHLVENSSRAFLDAVSRSMRQIRHAVGNNVIDPELLPMPRSCSTKATSGGSKLTKQSTTWPRMGRPSDKSSGKLVIAASSFATFCGGSGSMSSGPALALWTAGCLG